VDRTVPAGAAPVRTRRGRALGTRRSEHSVRAHRLRVPACSGAGRPGGAAAAGRGGPSTADVVAGRPASRARSPCRAGGTARAVGDPAAADSGLENPHTHLAPVPDRARRTPCRTRSVAGALDHVGGAAGPLPVHGWDPPEWAAAGRPPNATKRRHVGRLLAGPPRFVGRGAVLRRIILYDQPGPSPPESPGELYDRAGDRRGSFTLADARADGRPRKAEAPGDETDRRAAAIHRTGSTRWDAAALVPALHGHDPLSLRPVRGRGAGWERVSPPRRRHWWGPQGWDRVGVAGGPTR